MHDFLFGIFPYIAIGVGIMGTIARLEIGSASTHAMMAKIVPWQISRFALLHLWTHWQTTRCAWTNILTLLAPCLRQIHLWLFHPRCTISSTAGK